MTTSLDTLIVPVRYYSALDPYNWKVDNRPLSDLEDNDDVLRSGIETNLNIGKLQAATMGALHQNVFGRGKAVGHAYKSTGLTWRIERSLMNGWITDDGKEVATLALQVDPQVFVFTAPSAGNKTLITIYATYDLPNHTDLPYFDDTQFLDAGALSFPSLACKVGSVKYTTDSSTVVVSDPDTYPSTPSGSITLFHIKVLHGDTTLTDVTYVHFVEEGGGGAFNPAPSTLSGLSDVDTTGVLNGYILKYNSTTQKFVVSQADLAQNADTTSYGHVRFATPTEVTTGTSTSTVVSPADLAKKADTISYGLVRFATATEVTTGTSTSTVVSPADLKNRIAAIPAIPTIPPRTKEVITPNVNGNCTPQVPLPPGCKRVSIVLVGPGGGGGGGGGSNNTSHGAGGGGGGSGQVTEVDIRTDEWITVEPFDSSITYKYSFLLRSDGLPTVGGGGLHGSGATAPYGLAGNGTKGSDLSLDIYRNTYVNDVYTSGVIVFSINAKGGSGGGGGQSPASNAALGGPGGPATVLNTNIGSVSPSFTGLSCGFTAYGGRPGLPGADILLPQSLNTGDGGRGYSPIGSFVEGGRSSSSYIDPNYGLSIHGHTGTLGCGGGGGGGGMTTVDLSGTTYGPGGNGGNGGPGACILRFYYE